MQQSVGAGGVAGADARQRPAVDPPSACSQWVGQPYGFRFSALPAAVFLMVARGWPVLTLMMVMTSPCLS